MKRSPLKRAMPLRATGARAAREKAALQAFRREVFKRAKYTCERCGVFWPKTLGLEAHHRLPRARGGSHDPSNGAALCWQCHQSIHDHTVPEWREFVVETKPARPAEQRDGLE